MNVKTRGLIVKTIKLNDNDEIFTILTDDMKKITAFSKGIRSLKHKDFAALKPFCYSEFELRGNKGFYYILSAQVINNFYNLRSSVEKISFATYFADIASVAADFTVGDKDYLRLVLNSIYFLENAQNKAVSGDIITELKRIKSIFEIRTAVAAGFGPNLESCVLCSSQKDATFFDMQNGGIVCKNCKQENNISLSLESVKVLKIFAYSSMKDSFNLIIKKSWIIDEINQITENFLSLKLEYYFKSLDYLKKVAYTNLTDCK